MILSRFSRNVGAIYEGWYGTTFISSEIFTKNKSWYRAKAFKYHGVTNPHPEGWG